MNESKQIVDKILESLREAIACSSAGDTIKFAPLAFNDTIQLTSAQLTVSKDISIVTELNNDIFIEAVSLERVLMISPGSSVVFEGLEVICGNGVEGRCIFNEGVLTIHNVQLHDPAAGSGGNSVKNSGDIQLEGEIMIKKE